jgi:hypothetical protein
VKARRKQNEHSSRMQETKNEHTDSVSHLFKNGITKRKLDNKIKMSLGTGGGRRVLVVLNFRFMLPEA